MTDESMSYLEALKEIKRLKEALEQKPCDNNWRFYYNHGYAQAKRDLSCEDAVSRQAVIDTLDNHKYSNKFCEEHHIDRSINLGMAHIVINDLPSVTPKEKTGKWIDEADEIDAQFERHEYKCSECGRIANYYVGGNECWWDIYKPNFCPNCGSRMVESQESEDKEE